jgi:hypothetical protein
MPNSNKYRKYFNFISAGLCLAYIAAFIFDLKDFWFNPEWTTDDALQQTYIFHKVLNPQLFSGDIITEVMTGYLFPLHYWLTYFVTWLCADPIMTAHWVMLLQIALTFIFIFLLVRNLSDIGPAFLAVFWFCHTRTVMQRMTGGLPRGWAAPIIASFLYFLQKKNHKAVLLVLLAGCLLHPPSTLGAAATYAVYLCWHIFKKETRAEFLRPFIIFVALSPLYLLLTYSVVKRPESVGQMVTYQEALKMPEFSKPNGRFPFVPLNDLGFEVRTFGMDPVQNRLASVPRMIKKTWPFIFFGVLTGLFFLYIWRRRSLPGGAALICYFLCSVVIYLLSRLLAFKLYVPDRHLQYPFSVFWVVFTIALIWKFFTDTQNSFSKKHFLAFFLLVTFIFIGNGSGLNGSANFNFHKYKRGEVFEWLKNNTPINSVIAGHPRHIDGAYLFAARQAYATYETAHPFYKKFFEEMLRRHKISFQAHYSKDFKSFYDLLKNEDIDYFVFAKKRFYPSALKAETYFEPLSAFVKDLTSADPYSYLYKQVDKKADFVVFEDKESQVIDMRALGRYLAKNSL